MPGNIEHAIRLGYKPYRCSTIQSIGGCLGPECPSYKGAMTAEALQKEMTA